MSHLSFPVFPSGFLQDFLELTVKWVSIVSINLSLDCNSLWIRNKNESKGKNKIFVKAMVLYGDSVQLLLGNLQCMRKKGEKKKEKGIKRERNICSYTIHEQGKDKIVVSLRVLSLYRLVKANLV